MAEAGIFTTLGSTLVKSLVEQGIPLLAGGAGGAGLAKIFLSGNPLNNTDFRITTETTDLCIMGDPGSASHLRVYVKRKFTLRLRDEKKKGRYQVRVDLNGNNIEGKWDDGCAVYLDPNRPFELTFENDRSVIKARTPKLTREHELTVKLNSVEKISKGRRFYSLVITNPKDQTTFHWKVDDSANSIRPHARAFASSEDFDLVVLPEGAEHAIHESSHQVTYFITWSEPAA